MAPHTAHVSKCDLRRLLHRCKNPVRQLPTHSAELKPSLLHINICQLAFHILYDLAEQHDRQKVLAFSALRFGAESPAVCFSICCGFTSATSNFAFFLSSKMKLHLAIVASGHVVGWDFDWHDA